MRFDCWSLLLTNSAESSILALHILLLKSSRGPGGYKYAMISLVGLCTEHVTSRTKDGGYKYSGDASTSSCDAWDRRDGKLLLHNDCPHHFAQLWIARL